MQSRKKLPETIRLQESSYIVAKSPPADDRTQVLKHDETFAIFDRYGDIQPSGMGEQGIYHQGTRFLSHYVFRLGHERPFLLSSSTNDSNVLFTVDCTNPDISVDGKIIVPRGTLHIFRGKFLWKGRCYERLRISNFGLFTLDVSFGFQFEADFADIFEVRGFRRDEKGTKEEDVLGSKKIQLSYTGLDGVLRRTVIQSSREPNKISTQGISFEKTLKPKSEASYLIIISCEESKGSHSHVIPYKSAYAAAEKERKTRRETSCTVTTSNQRFNDWLNRSFVDLQMMMTTIPEGQYPFAGVPWFSTPFGRDGLITAFELLWIQPQMAKGVLTYLAATQAKEVAPEQDAEPGKILHETRKGELAAIGQIPFGRYYGSVDSTPLFLILAYEYYQRTGDIELIENIWPNIQLALRWIDHYGDQDGDGFIEYQKKSPNGLIQQGWKDSHDSVFHADGTLAEGPIALCEVQGYVYAAKAGVAKLASSIGHAKMAERLMQEAKELKARFIERFWSKELSTYILALDGNKQPCAVRTSNSGHTLFSGIADSEHAAAVADSLLDDDFFSGWGIRTVAKTEPRYNPMSYHNGSVWPHDNALIAFGLSRYRFKQGAMKILSAFFDVSYFVKDHRLPELLCGFRRRPNEGPTRYPVACSPQAWSAGAVYLLLQSTLGLSINAPTSEILFRHPIFPKYLSQVRIDNLQVGSSSVDLLLERHEDTVGIHALNKTGNVQIVTIK